MLVKLESMSNLAAALENATEMNNISELKKSLDELNSLQGVSNHKELMRHIRKHIEDLDPFEPVAVVNYILENLKPELKKLVDPAHMILSSPSPNKRSWFRCFQETRT